MTTSRISIDVDPKEHRMFKLYATAKYSSLKEFFLQAAREKLAHDRAKTPNAETLQAFHDSENNVDLTVHENLDDLFEDLGI